MVMPSLDVRPEFVAWWATLSDVEREEMTERWAAETSESPDAGDSGAFTVLLEARFVESARGEELLVEAEERLALATLDDWIQGHPEYAWGLTERTFHICRAHPKARAAVRAGVVPADFRCPLARDQCPMRKLLNTRPGCAAVLSVARQRPQTSC